MTKEEAIKEAYGIPVNKKQHEALQILIPELAESEDERIRKAILSGLEYLEKGLGWDAVGDVDILDARDWLEKQKEPTEGIKENLEEIPSNVDLEKEIDEWLKAGPITDTRYDDYCDDDIQATARHFYELGLNARKEK